MAENEALYRQILDESSDPIFSFFPDGTYRYVNHAFAEGVGLPVGSIMGHKISDVFPPDEAEKRFSAVKQAFDTGEDRNLEVKVVVGEKVSWYLTTVRPIRNDEGAVATVVCVSKNITDRKFAEERLQFFATTDELTGVANRRTVLAILQKLLDMARRSGAPFSLMYGDIDGLKRVNDAWGHAAGDHLIVACCDAVRQSIRQADTIGRMGGDEFLVLLPDCDEGLAGDIEARIHEQLDLFNRGGTQPWKAGLSLGVLGCRGQDQDSSDRLLNRLDELMYLRKRAKTERAP